MADRTLERLEPLVREAVRVVTGKRPLSVRIEGGDLELVYALPAEEGRPTQRMTVTIRDDGPPQPHPPGPGCERHAGDPHNLCPECWKLEP